MSIKPGAISWKMEVNSLNNNLIKIHDDFSSALLNAQNKQISRVESINKNSIVHQINNRIFDLSIVSCLNGIEKKLFTEYIKTIAHIDDCFDEKSFNFTMKFQPTVAVISQS